MNAQVMDPMMASIETLPGRAGSAALQDRRAIAAKFVDARGRLDVRHLWTRNGHRYYRVNWWTGIDEGDASVLRSAFVSVEDADGATVVTDHTRKAA